MPPNCFKMRINQKYLLKKFSLFLLLFFTLTQVNAQIDFFNVHGDWSGNDANGNAIIKWEIEICNGPLRDTATVRVPALERNENQSGGVGIADEDSPADDSVCNGFWFNGFNTYRPSNYLTTGILLEDAPLNPNQCLRYSWISYSKDYDSDTQDYDHYVVANYSSVLNPWPETDFTCPTDGHIVSYPMGRYF